MMSTEIRATDEAFVTLATNDRYALGALVLCSSLKRVKTTRQLVVMVTSGVSEPVRGQLLCAFDIIVAVDVLNSNDAYNLNLLGRPDLGLTFTKLHCWRLTQFTKCVFLDADTLVLQNIDDLFDREELSAAPDVGWPDCFNSGVFVYQPSLETYSKLLELGLSKGSFDGGDQGLLNLFFSDWSTKNISRHLPFVYNVVGVAFYSYLPAFKQFGRDTKVAHFIGKDKPWNLSYNTATGQLDSHGSYMQNIASFAYIWWKIFMEDVHHKLIGHMASLVSVFERHPTPTVNHAPPPPRQPVTYHMMTPFVLPDIPVFYKPSHIPLPPPSESSPAKYVENADGRSYGHLESFYVEPPIKHQEAYPEAGHVYAAKDFSQVWAGARHVEVPETKRAATTHATASENTVAPELLPTITTVSAAEQSDLLSSTIHVIDERQHQYNWERGQIDYLGIDSFENILTKLNSALEEEEVPPEKPSGSTHPTKTSSIPVGGGGSNGSKKTRGVKTSPSVVPGSIPGDRVERITRADNRSRVVVTDEGAVFYKPGSNSPPAIAAGDKQLDHIEREMSVEIRKQRIYIDSSTGEPDDRLTTAEERISRTSVEASEVHGNDVSVEASIGDGSHIQGPESKSSKGDTGDNEDANADKSEAVASAAGVAPVSDEKPKTSQSSRSSSKKKKRKN